MDIQHLKSIIDQAISDYSQLGDKRKNPKYADFENDTKRKTKRSIAAATYVPTKIAGAVIDSKKALDYLLNPNIVHTSDNDVLAALQLASIGQTGGRTIGGTARSAIYNQAGHWLDSGGVDPKLRNKLIKINNDVERNDRPGEVLKDDAGNILFSSNDQAAHIVRKAIAADKFANQFANHPELKFNQQDLTDNLAIAFLHDIGKPKTPPDILNRVRNFPPEGMTYADMQDISYKPGNLGSMMKEVLKRNPDPETKFWDGLSGANDMPIMKNHVNKWKEATDYYQVPVELSKKANMHHLHYDGNEFASYPKEFADIKSKDIPVEARIQSLFDSTDAAASPRYGMSGPKNYDEFMEKMRFYKGQSTLGTQFDPDLFKLAEEGGNFRNFHENIANKVGYSLANLIKQHRIDTYGKKAIEDFITPNELSVMNRIAIANSTNDRKKKD